MKILLKIFCKIVVLICVCVPVAMSAIRGTFNFDANGEGFTNGDLVSSKLFISPWEGSGDTHFLRGYVGKTFLEHFYVVDVVNAEVADGSFVAHLRVVIKKNFDGQSMARVSLGGHDIPVAIGREGFIPTKNNVENFLLFNQAVGKDWTLQIILGALLVGLTFFGAWVGIRYYGKRKRRMERAKAIEEERQELIFLINNVESKEDIQRLYAERDRLKEIFVRPRQFKEILMMMDEHQYKSRMSEQVIFELRNKLKNGI